MDKEKKDAGRVSAYLKGDDLLLLQAIKEECNHKRRVTCDNNYAKKYKPIGNSELIVQLLTRYKETSRKAFVEKLEYHSRQAEYYKDRLRAINNIKKEELLLEVKA